MLGDVNTSLIQTANGKTIYLVHDTNLPRPYSRAFMVQGSHGLARKYPTEKIHLEGLTKGHDWEESASLKLGARESLTKKGEDFVFVEDEGTPAAKRYVIKFGKD